ncbi:DUF1963 domain-containing protein [Winogradskyella sediminis]|uniref:DUF1963 domain-containing protein n=1 Tax=Winogradskyella sediminis TaxID=1382466 RepID=UPI003AA942E5
MNFWNKLFGKMSHSQKTESDFNQYQNDLNKLNLKSSSDLENLVKPLLRKTTQLNIQPASRPTENAQLESHFGGLPYFEKGEKWPTKKNGKHLDFIFQIFNKPELELPKNIALVQFFYDWEEMPWDTKDEGWLVKIYSKIHPSKIELIPKPTDLYPSKYCQIKYKTVQTLPDWEGIDVFGRNASKLSCVLNEDEPWDNYDQIVSKLIGEQEYQSQLGGYPTWVQGEATPIDSKGKPMKLLFQIDSEDNAGLMWGDAGLVYVFYDENTGDLEFVLQCH